MRTGALYQRYHGLYLGTVVSVDDREKLGRVRIKCDQYDDFEDDPTWCAVARPAGGDTSVFFRPKAGDQVVVAFLVGAVNEPIVLGCAHHSSNRTPPKPLEPGRNGIVTGIESVLFDEKDSSDRPTRRSASMRSAFQ